MAPKLNYPAAHFDISPAVSPARGLRSTLPKESADDANWWMITLSDLTLLLLGFMVVWYVTGKPNPAPQTASTTPAVSPAARQDTHAAADSSAAQETLTTVQSDLLGFVKGAGLSDDVTVEALPNEVVLSLRDTVPFASGKADLRARALPVLQRVVGIMLRHGNLSVAISGHTDSVRIATREFPSNWELSAARASRVARYLVERGVHPERIAVEGYASFRPRAASNPRALSLNRRVEIRLINDSARRPNENTAPHQ